LSNANVPLSDDWLNDRNEYSVSGRADEIVVTLTEESLMGCDSMLADVFLLERTAEEPFLAAIGTMREAKDLRIASIRTIALDYYPEHLLGLLLRVGRTRVGTDGTAYLPAAPDTAASLARRWRRG